MKKITIDRKIWLRGKMCCVGIYLSQCKVPKKELLDMPDAASVSEREVKIPKQAEWLLDRRSYGVNDFYCDNSDAAGKLMTLNDRNPNEKKIAAIFAKNGVEIEFIN